ncbi:hypothetical protein BDV06DRAFT_217228 [Aspergillus oleicola]
MLHPIDQLSGASKAPTLPSTLPSPLSTTSGYHPKRRVLIALAQDISLSNPLTLSLIPESVIALRKRLMDGFGHNIIPQGLKSRICAYNPYSTNKIPQTAFSNSNTLSNAILNKLWSDLKTIYFNARQCDIYGKDKNTWCLDIPILNSLIKGCQLLQLISMQSQQIDPSLLPRSKNALSKISKKADYTLSFTCHAFTKRILLFSGMEVKLDKGSKKEALAQLAIWLAASLERIRQLGEQVKGKGKDSANWLQPTIGITIIGHDWYMYLAYKVGNKVHIISPVSTIITDTWTIYGILKVRDLVRRVAEYAIQVYWP